MAVYLFSFCVFIALFKAAERVKRNQRGFLEYIAIILLCLLAACRSIEVGTDTQMYLQPCIRTAIQADSYSDFLKSTWYYGYYHIQASNYEPGFLMTIYFSTKIFRSVVVVQFILQILMILPVYAVLNRNRNVPTWFGMLVYVLVFFNLSLNAIRQSVTMSFLLLSTQLWINGRKKKSIIALLVGTTFHVSGWIGGLILAIYSFVQKERKNTLRLMGRVVEHRYANMIIVILAGIAFLLGANLVAELLRKTSLGRFALYITGDIKFMPNQLIKLLPPLVIILINFKNFDKYSDQGRFYLTLLFLSVIFLQFTSVNAFGGRIADYFMYFGILSYPTVCRCKSNSKLTTAIMIGYLMFYWFYYYGFSNSGETIPYKMLQ